MSIAQRLTRADCAGRLVLFATLFVPAYTAGADRSKDRPLKSRIDQIVGRSTLLFSCKIRCQYRSFLKHGGRFERDTIRSVTLVSRGEDWLLQYPDSPNRVATFGEVCLRFYETGQNTPKHYRALHIEASRPPDESVAEQPVLLILRAGTLPFRSQTVFLRKAADRAKALARVEIESHNIEPIEFPVGPHELDDALAVVTPQIAHSRKGRLVLLPFAEYPGLLARIEYRTESGKLEYRLDARDVRQLGKDMYFPMQLRSEFYSTDDQGNSIVEGEHFTVLAVERVNEPIEDELFSLTVPAGTRVRDSRPGRPPVTFTLTTAQPLEQLGSVVNVAQGPRWKWPSFRVTCLILNLLLIALLLVYFVAARR